MGRYLRRLIEPIAERAIGFCATGESDPELRLVSRGNSFYPAWEQVSLPNRIREENLSVFLAPYNTAPLRLPSQTRLILVLHDLIYLRPLKDVPLSRSAYQNFGRLYRRAIVPRAIRRAFRIVCVSQHTRNELIQRFRVDPEKVYVIPNTIEESWFEGGSRASGDYVLTVSGEAPNKNLQHGIEGFAAYCRVSRDKTTRLKIAGVKSGYHQRFRQMALQLGIADRLEFVPYLSDRELQRLYRGARAFFFPSREEGFGIPLLEAMASGLPVIASNSSSIPEVAGEAALYFHPDSPKQMAEHLATVLSNPVLQQTMIARGRQRAMLFRPDRVGSKIAEFWREVMADE